MSAAEVIIRRVLIRETWVEMSLGMTAESRSFRASSTQTCSFAVLDLANHTLIILAVQFAFTVFHMNGEDVTIRYHRRETWAHVKIWGILLIYRNLVSGNHFAYDIIMKRSSSERREMGANLFFRDHRSAKVNRMSWICPVIPGSSSPSNLREIGGIVSLWIVSSDKATWSFSISWSKTPEGAFSLVPA